MGQRGSDSKRGRHLLSVTARAGVAANLKRRRRARQNTPREVLEVATRSRSLHFKPRECGARSRTGLGFVRTRKLSGALRLKPEHAKTWIVARTAQLDRCSSRLLADIKFSFEYSFFPFLSFFVCFCAYLTRSTTHSSWQLEHGCKCVTRSARLKCDRATSLVCDGVRSDDPSLSVTERYYPDLFLQTTPTLRVVFASDRCGRGRARCDFLPGETKDLEVGGLGCRRRNDVVGLFTLKRRLPSALSPPVGIHSTRSLIICQRTCVKERLRNVLRTQAILEAAK